MLLGPQLNGIEVLVRTRGNDSATVAAAVDRIREAGGKAGLWIDGTAGAVDVRIAAPSYRVLVDLSAETGEPEQVAFALKTRATELRAAAPDALIGIRSSRELFAELLRREVSAYVDFHGTDAERPAFPRSAAGADTAIALSDTGSAGNTSRRLVVRVPDDVVAAQALVRDVSQAAQLLPEGLVAGGMADIRCGSARLATFLDPESLATVAVARECRAGVSVSPEAPGVERVALSAGETIVRVPAAEGRFAEGVRVTGARALSVREIIARHQAAAARQRRAIRQSIATGTMTLTFEAPGFPAPMTITSQAVIYTAPDATEIEQRDIRVNGIAFAGGRVPRLPLLEPERVASPPLAIALSDVYTYGLAGQTDVGGVRCYAVTFAPTDKARSLFAGTAWIAIDSFAMVKVSAVQTALRGAIVSSEQTDEFRPDANGWWLLTRSDVRQLYEGAGHRTPIHRVLAIDHQEVNPEAFEARLRAAYASPSVILRDTPQGYRYIKREPAGGATPATAVQTELAGPSERVRTLALGVIIDPNISIPLPFAGLSYVDFNLFGTGTQLNGFFGGTYGQLAISVPSLGGTRWQLAGRAFGIASSYNDRAFVEGREHYEWNITQRPAHASAWLLRPLSPRLTMRAGYELDYTGFGDASSTAATFAVPASQVSHAIRLGMDGQRGGWSGSFWWSAARRAGWRGWGDPAGQPGLVGVGEYDPRHRDYQRTGASLAKSVVLSPRVVGRAEVSWMAGRDLDRFSRYTFGSFDNRLRGYPSALIRYDRGAVFRGSAAWATGKLLRLDGFVDSALVRDPGFGSRNRSYSGLGAAAEVPAPFGTLVAIEWGYGFQGVNSDGGRGTQVIRISGYKIF